MGGRSKNSSFRFFGFWLSLSACALALAGNAAGDQTIERDAARRMVQVFSRDHLSRAPFDTDIAVKAWTNLLSALDPERIFFTAADIRSFEPRKATLAEEIRSGDLSFGKDVFELYSQRLSNRYDYVCTLLDKGFDVTISESYFWKRKDAPWAEGDAEWNELWRKRIKNEYVRHLVDKELRERQAEKAKDKSTPAATNETEKVESFPDPDLALTPQEFIRKRYKQLLTVMADADSDWITQLYLTSVCMAYDPHSGYMSPASRENFDIEMKLSLCGIGAVLRPDDGTAKIERTIPGGPAERDGRLRAGDRIIAVGQNHDPLVDILHWPLDKAVKLIRGEKGSRVVLKVIPASDVTGSSFKIVDLIRDEVKLEDQAAKGELRRIPGEGGRTRSLAVVKLPAFYANMQASAGDEDYRSSTDDVRAVLEEMKEAGAEGVLLDLRNNGGGSLVEAIRMTGLFLRSGPVVQVRERSAIRVLTDPDSSVTFSGPLVVLVNRMSASASEILAGALQDYGRALILGDTKTHGKGTVQSVLDLSRTEPLGSVRITTASFYRITGASTQIRGVTSDIVISSPFDFMEIGEEFLTCPMPWTQVPPAYYRPLANVSLPLVDRLRLQSAERRQGDPLYASYTRLLSRIEEMNRSSEIPLRLDERRKLAETEKEILDLQDSVLDDATPDEGKKERKDLVLIEALAVLSDLVAATENQPPNNSVNTVEAGRRTLAQDMMDWLRNNLQPKENL